MIKSFEEMTANERIRRARTMLVLGTGDEPFYGSIALGLELVECNRIPTGVTDGKILIYNTDWIESIDSIEEVMGFVEHEVLHGAMKHPLRQFDIEKSTDFDGDLWSMACDYAINPILVNKNRKLPGKPLYESRFNDMAAERIYSILFEEKQQQQQQQGQHGSGNKGSGDEDGDENGQCKKKTQDNNGKSQTNKNSGSSKEKPGNGNSKSLSGPKESADNNNQNNEQNRQQNNGKEKDQSDLNKALDNFKDPGGCGGTIPPMNMETEEQLKGDELKDFKHDFENRVVNAARQIEKNQGNIPGFLKDIVEAHTTPQVTYKDQLRDIMEEITRDDYSMARPNRKFDEIYIPTLYDKIIVDLAIAVDASGSVSKHEQQIYASEISGILEEFPQIKIVILFHDTHVRHKQEVTPEDLPIKLEIRGGGGTSYKPVIDYIEKNGIEPKVLLWFTDLWVGQYTYNQIRPIPDYEVFWLNTSAPTRRSNPTFGTVIDLDPNA